MLLGSFEARFSFGLLVVSAPESMDSHDDWDPATEAVHAGPDSLYIGVRQSASGLVKVSCVTDDELEIEFPRLFSGNLSLPSARLKLYDPDETICMIVPVDDTSMQVAVYGDNEDESSELVICLSQMDM